MKKCSKNEGSTLPRVGCSSSRSRRTLAVLTAGIFCSGALGWGAAHAAYPEKPVKVIVNFAVGGSTDVAARFIAHKLTDALGQPFVVENRLGAGGAIGAEYVAKSAPDGYTIGVFAGSFSVTPSLYRKLPFDSIKDFAPIVRVADLSFVLVTNPALPVKSVKDMIDLAKKQQLSFGSGGTGNVMHIGGELLNSMAGIRMNHVPYKGGAPAINDLLGGHVSVVIAPAEMAVKHIETGKLRALGVAGSERSPLLPQVPTIAESVPGYEMSSWVGFFAPAGTPPDVIARLNTEINKALTLPDVKEQFRSQSLVPIGGAANQFSAFVREDIDKWADRVKRAGVEPLN